MSDGRSVSVRLPAAWMNWPFHSGCPVAVLEELLMKSGQVVALPSPVYLTGKGF